MSQILIYDAASRDLREREARLEEPARLLGWSVQGYTSRNGYLRAVSQLPPRTAARETAISLIDLARNDTDLRFSGFEIVDVMARHPRLRGQSQRVVLTRYFDQEVIAHANGLRAHGVVDLNWLETSPASVIASSLRSLAARPAVPRGVIFTATDGVPGVGELLEPLRSGFERAKAAHVIGPGVGWNGVTTLQALVAIAEDVPPELIPEEVRSHHKHLRARIQPSSYREGKNAIAQQFLIRYAPALPREIQLNWLPRLVDARDWLRENRLRDASWLLESDRSLLLKLLLGGVVPEPKNVREATEAFNNLVAAALAHVRSDLGHPLGGQSESDMSAHLRRMLYTLKLTALDEAGI